MMNDSSAVPRASWLEGTLCKGRMPFYVAACVVVTAVLAPGFALYRVVEQRISGQDLRNGYLENEIEKLDRQIYEIQRLREEANKILSRTELLEVLQNARASDVALFNFLARSVPAGVQLVHVELKQQGTLELQGLARSGDGVTALMRNIEAAPFLEKPVLVSTEAREDEGRQLQAFTVAAHALVYPKPAPVQHKNAAPPARSPQPSRPSQPQHPPAAPAPEAMVHAPAENEGGWDWTVAAVIAGGAMALLAAGWLVWRWRRRRAAARIERRPFFRRASDEFGALDPRDLSTWGLIPRLAVLFEFAAIAVAVCWLVVGIAMDELDWKLQKEEGYKQSFLEKKRVAVNLDLIKKQYLQIQQTRAPLLKSVPSRLDASTFISAVGDAARKAGVSVTQLEPQAETAGAFVKMPLAVQAAGTFDGIGGFAANLAKMQTLVTLESFELAPDESNGNRGKKMKLRFTGVIAAYRDRADAEPGAASGKSGGASK